MAKLFFAIITGLVGAAILHIVILLGIPRMSSQDVWARAEALGAAENFLPLDTADGSKGLSTNNPFLRAAICRFEIGERPIRITARGNVRFWSLAVFDRRSNEIYSMNDRNSANGGVDITLASPLQMIVLRRAVPPNLENSILVEISDSEAYAVLRTVAADETWERIARNFLSEARCEEVDVL